MKKNTAIIKKAMSFIISAALIFCSFPADAACITAYASESYHYYSEGKSYESAAKYIARKLEECPSEIDLLKFDITPEELQSIIDDVLLSRPDIFYVSTTYTYYIGTKGSKKTVIKLVPEYIYPTTSVPRMRKELEKAADELLSGMDKSLPDELKALYIHDALAMKMEYKGDNEIRSAYEGLVKGKALCVAYALAYKYLADKAGLKCVCAISSEIEHCWNQVKINGKWYNVDVTFDDPIPDFYGQITHDYVLVSDKTAGDGYGRKDLGYAATDRSFENAAWRKSESQVIIAGGKCIYNDPYLLGIYSYDYKRGKTERLVRVTDSWTGYRGCNFARLVYSGGRVYFNTQDKIKSFSVKNPSDVKTELSPKIDKGYEIFGMKEKNGALCYQISKEHKNGPFESKKAFSLSDTKTSSDKPASPKELKGKTGRSGGKSYITLSWKSVSNADGYIVYRYDKKTKTKKKIADVKGTSYTVKNLKSGEYTFAVSAYKKTGGKTAEGELSSLLTKKV